MTKAPVAVLSAALARCGNGGPTRIAGGGMLIPAPARTLIPQKKTGRDALNVPA